METILNKWNLNVVDLIQINIEGDEYPLLENMLKTGLINKFKNIQIQYHLGIEGDIERKPLQTCISKVDTGNKSIRCVRVKRSVELAVPVTIRQVGDVALRRTKCPVTRPNTAVNGHAVIGNGDIPKRNVYLPLVGIWKRSISEFDNVVAQLCGRD